MPYVVEVDLSAKVEQWSKNTKVYQEENDADRRITVTEVQQLFE